MPKKIIPNRLDEASNLSIEDRMRAWANGQRRENIRAASDAKLNDFMNTLSSLAVDEARKNNMNLAVRLTNKLLDIESAYHARGNTSGEQTARAMYNNTNSQVNNMISNWTRTEQQFAKNAFSVFQKLLVDNKSEFDSMINTVDSLNSLGPVTPRPSSCPYWVHRSANIVKDLLDNYLYKITEKKFYNDFVADTVRDDKYLLKVIDDSNCIVMNNSVTPCNYTEFGERIFAIYYLIAILAAQAEIFSRKIMTKYKSKGIYCAVIFPPYLDMLGVEISVCGPDESIASCAIDINLDDIRSASLADLKSRKVTVIVDYEIYIGPYPANALVATGDNMVPALKDFWAKLYSCL